MILAFSGKRGYGKTTAAKYLTRCYGFTTKSFAETLKEMCKNDFDFSDEHLYGKLKEAPFQGYDWSPREYMLKKGQFLRYFDPDYWIKRTLTGVLPEDMVVIDDLRYLNEANLLKSKGAKLIRIERQKGLTPYKDNKFDNDESETQLDSFPDFDFRINEIENLTMKSLNGKLDYIMDELGVPKLK